MKQPDTPPWFALGILPLPWFMQSENERKLSSEAAFNALIQNLNAKLLQVIEGNPAIQKFSTELKKEHATAFKKDLSEKVNAITNPIYTKLFMQLGKGFAATSGGIIGVLFVFSVTLGVYAHVELTTAALACITLVVAALAVSIGFAIKGYTMLKHPVNVLMSDTTHLSILTPIAEALPNATKEAVCTAAKNKMDSVNKENWLTRAGKAIARGSTKKNNVASAQTQAISFANTLNETNTLSNLLHSR